MKVKKIGIAHTGLFKGLGVVEKLFNNIVNELEEDGRTLRYMNKERAIFEDGTSVIKFRASEGSRAYKLTHLYIEETIFILENGRDLVMDVLMPTVIDGTNYSNLDAETPARERALVFSNNGDIKHLFGE